MSPIIRRCLLLVALLLPLWGVHGQTYDKQWTGATSSSWFTPSNWNPSGAPSSTQSARISAGGSGPVLNSATTSITDLGVGIGALGQLNLGNAGVLQTFDVVIGASTGSGPFPAFGNGLVRLDGAGARLNARSPSARSLRVGTSLSQGRLEVLNGGLVDGSFDIVASFNAGVGEILVSGNNARINLGSASARRIDLLGGSHLVVRSGGAVNLGGTIEVADVAELAIGARFSEAPQPAGNLSANIINLSSNDSRFTLNHTGTATVAGNIQGTGELAVVRGFNILTGTVSATINPLVTQDAALQFGLNGTTGALAGNATVAGSIIFSRSDSYTYTGVISGSGALVTGGSGGLRLVAPQTYGGGTSIFSGVLELAHSARITGPVLNNFGLLVNQSDSWTWSGNSHGSGALAKRGTGTLTLTGTHTHAGVTQVDLGTLRINAGSLNNSGSAVLVGTNQTNPATLTVNNNATLNTSSTMLGANAGSQGVVTLDNSAWTVSGNVIVGNNGRGTMEVRNGTIVNLDNIVVAAGSNGSSILRVTGGTSRLNVAGQLFVGGNGPGLGLMEIMNGAEVSAGWVIVGLVPGRTVEDRLALLSGSLLEVAQTYEQGSDSALQLFLSPTGPGQIQVSETATINAGALLRVESPGFTPTNGSQYTVLTAAGGLTGTYTLDTTIPNANLIHTANSVILQIGDAQDVIFHDRFQ